jgi:alpha-glucosidase
MKSIKFIVVIFLLYCGQVLAQSTVLSPGNIETVHVDEHGLSFKTTNAYGSVTIYSPAVVRVRLDKKVLGRDFSYAVIQTPGKTKLNVLQGKNEITINTDSLKIVINRKPFAIAFYTPGGQVINQDEPGLTTSWVGDEVTAYKTMNADERFIGLGEKAGNLDRKGNAYTNWNEDHFGYSVNQDPLYATIPFYVGIHHNLNYGLFFDNTYQSDFNFGASNDRFSSFGAKGGEMNYYFIYHTRLADIITSYAELTGRMKMPPLWSLGYQQNRYSYYPDTEVMRIANTLREKKIPSDGITLDIHYMDQYQLFTWDKKRFPDPVNLSSQLNKLGFKLTVIVDPGIKVQQDAAAYQSGIKDDVFIKYADNKYYTGQVWPGWCNFPDFTSEKGRTWWRKQTKFFSDNGVSGIWNDMNEIATWGQKMPSNVLFNYDGQPTSHLQAHNVYGMQMARASYEGARENFKERPFILTRAGYAGLQRYAAIWTGDNRSEDNHMMLGVRLLSSLGISGIPFTAMDVGGFTGGPSTELYIRWMQIGAFIPYFRNHTQLNTKSAEPWTFGEDALEITRDYINLRYKLLPYLYSTFYESSQNGLPVVRSLAINYTFNSNVYKPAYQNQYLFGNSFLVAPFESDKQFGKIFLPKGLWYDLYTDAKMQGDNEIVKELSINQLPVYVKESSIIPMQSLVQSTAEMPTDTLTLHIYNGSVPNQFVYYEDDGKTYDYEKNDFYKRVIEFDPTKLSITLGQVDGAFATKFHHIQLLLHGFEQLKKATLDRAELKFSSGKFKIFTGKSGANPHEMNSDKGPEPVYEININNSSKKQMISLIK